ncbi:MAG: hypothetical protein Q4A96_00235 [Candidatus Saccharibacteria bacterium]|nr:hypothetical protein [Candidatus Saccharibacteria bacterium]
MLLLEQVAQLYEKFGASTSIEDKETVAKQICFECSMAIWKLCSIDIPSVYIDSDTVMQYYELARLATKKSKACNDDSERMIIEFYAGTLKEKCIWLCKLYGTKS